MRALIIEDEVRIAKTLREIFMEKKFIADIALDGEIGLENALSGIYDIIILDLLLPKMDGYEVMKKIRSGGVSTPVLMLTAKTRISDCVKGLNCGADYYLTKPFSTAELMACVRALLRRPAEVSEDKISFYDLILYLENAKLCCGENEIYLSAKEFELMRQLIKNGNNRVPKEKLYEKVWGNNSKNESNVLEVYITFLRKKLAHLESSCKIVAKRNTGYNLEPEDQT